MTTTTEPADALAAYDGGVGAAAAYAHAAAIAAADAAYAAT